MIMRPTYKELDGKINKAIEAVKSGNVVFVNQDAADADLLDLDILPHDFQSALLEALNDIRPKHYSGQRPPMRSYESLIRDAELFAFSFDCDSIGCRIYVKFAIKLESFFLVSFHKDHGKK